MVRLAKCCRPVPGDDDRRLHLARPRDHDPPRRLPERRALKRNPDRFTPVAWEGEQTTAFKVEIQVDGWDRHRLLEDLSRTFSEAGMNIVEAQCTANPPMIRNRFVVECADTQYARSQTISRLRNIDSVFDAFRVTPGGGLASGPGLRPATAARRPSPPGLRPAGPRLQRAGLRSAPRQTSHR